MLQVLLWGKDSNQRGQVFFSGCFLPSFSGCEGNRSWTCVIFESSGTFCGAGWEWQDPQWVCTTHVSNPSCFWHLPQQVIGSDVKLSGIRSTAIFEHTVLVFISCGVSGGCAGLVSHDFIPIFWVVEGLLPASSASAWTFQSFLNWSRLKRRVFV